jgi:CheY-like chemotaxis protein
MDVAAQRQETILLIEDDVILAMDERLGLQRHGYNVVLANSAQEALDAVAGPGEIDLVLADMDLGSDIDGAETANRILAVKNLPIVFLSSHIEYETVKKTEILPTYGYVVKDADITVLLASIKMALSRFKAYEQSLQEGIKLQRTLESLPDLLFEVGLDGTFYGYKIPASGSAYKPSLDFIGKKIPDLLPSDVAKIAMSAIREANEKGLSTGKWYELSGASGKICFEISVTYMVGNYDSPHFVFITRDITRSKLEEERLRASNRMLQAVLDKLPLKIAWKNLHSEYLGCNKAYAELFELRTTESIVGKIDSELPGKIGRAHV